MTTHIEHVVSRYRGKIKTWHVVNEPIDDTKGPLPGLRPTSGWKIWARITSTWRFAPRIAVDPAAELLICEYDVECTGRHRRRNGAKRS